MNINILQQTFEDKTRIMGNIERNKLISLWMDFPSKRCGWISIVDLTVIETGEGHMLLYHYDAFICIINPYKEHQ